MKNSILVAGLVVLASLLAAVQAQAQPVEYVRICDTYGAGFFYIPGTEQCYRPSDGQLRYVDPITGEEVVTETPFAARVREMEAKAAISNALEDPDLVEGERFGIRLNWGATETTDAIGVTGAILLGGSLAAGGTRMLGTGGLGFADGFVGARFGFQMNW
jgi:hypothetical protein